MNYASALCIRAQIWEIRVLLKHEVLWQALVESLTLVLHALSKSYVSKDVAGLTLSNLEWDVAKGGQGAVS